MARKLLLLGVSVAALSMAIDGANASEIDDLRAELRAVTQQLQSLQAQQGKLEQQLDGLQATSQGASAPAAATAQAPTSGSTPTASTQATTQTVAAANPANTPAAVKSPPGTFLIPGTNTTLKIGGYVKLDIVDDVAGANLNGQVVDLQSIPLNGTPQARRTGSLNFSARQSRVNVGTSTPTEYGPLNSFVEGDFYGSNSTAVETNSASFRLRQAYAELGPVLFGQSWTVFDDVEAIPETLDFGGPAGVAYGLRQPQLRYTADFGTDGKLLAALENPEGDFLGADHGTFVPAGSTTSTRVLNQVPDITARYTIKPSWGRISVGGVVREIHLDTGGTAQTFQGPTKSFTYAGEATTWGGGGVADLQIPTFGKDTLTFWAEGGPGLGRYQLQSQDEVFAQGISPFGATNANPGDAAVLDSRGQLHAITALGGNVWYRHYWTDKLRSNITYGRTYHDNPSAYLPVNTVSELQSLHANLIWSPIPQTNFGAEYIYGSLKLDGQTAANTALGYGSQGTMHRVQFSAQYQF